MDTHDASTGAGTPEHPHAATPHKHTPSHRKEPGMDTPPIITPHQLVTTSALRYALRGYAAPIRTGDGDQVRHRARIATALAVAAPAIIAEFLAPLVSYLDDRAIGHFTTAYYEHQAAGDTTRYQHHRAVALAYDHAAELLAHHAAAFSGDSPHHVAAIEPEIDWKDSDGWSA